MRRAAPPCRATCIARTCRRCGRSSPPRAARWSSPSPTLTLALTPNLSVALTLTVILTQAVTLTVTLTVNRNPNPNPNPEQAVTFGDVRGDAREEVKLQLGEHFFLSSVEAAQAGAL